MHVGGSEAIAVEQDPVTVISGTSCFDTPPTHLPSPRMLHHSPLWPMGSCVGARFRDSHPVDGFSQHMRTHDMSIKHHSSPLVITSFSLALPLLGL